MAALTPMKYPGIQKTKTGYRVRVRALDPRTGRMKGVKRLYEGITLEEAIAKQLALRDELQSAAQRSEQVRVGDFAKLWLDTKTPTIDLVTAKRYAYVLEDHVLPKLGRFFIDTLRPLDIQKWINDKVRAGYRAVTIRCWFGVLRTMMRDAVSHLDLPRDPTQRITLPPGEEREEANALTPEQLATFLDHARLHYPGQYGFLAVLAYTGLRFCHASALMWSDWDEKTGVILVRRKQVNGKVGPVSRKKRAPREIPVLPELKEILEEHRKRMVEEQTPGLAEGWMFPSDVGKLKERSSHRKALHACAIAAGVEGRFSGHGLRRTFNDLARRASVDPVITRSMTGARDRADARVLLDGADRREARGGREGDPARQGP
jgi:integrase